MISIPLKYRIAITIFLLEAVMLGVVLWLTLSSSYTDHRIHMKQTEQVTLNLLSNLSRSALLTEEYADLQPFIQDATKDPHIQDIFLANDQDRIVVSTTPSEVGTKLDPLREGLYPLVDTANQYWQTRLISDPTGRLGLLAIRFSKNTLAQSYQKTLNLGISIAGFGMIIIAIVGLMIGFLLTRRLNLLAEAADEIAIGQPYKIPEFSGNDEMAKVGKAFNRMIKDIDKQFHIIQSDREQLRALSRRLHSAQEEERTHIAREIHDELGQILSALKMDLFWFWKHLFPGIRNDPPTPIDLETPLERVKLDPKTKNPSEIREILAKYQEMEDLIMSAIGMIRRIGTDLRPGVLDDLGLVAAIDWQAKEFQKRSSIECRVFSLPGEMDLERNLKTTIFRVLQESLNNVASHARARKVDVSFKQNGNQLILTVQDDGIGISQDQVDDPKSLGLIGMRERIHPFAGEVSITGTTGKGTTVRVSLPIKKNL